MKCRLCESERKLVKAHIIPEAFFRKLSGDWRAPMLMTNIKGIHPKKSPIGVYDSGILCSECEGRFDVWDQYGSELLLQQLSTFQEIKDGREVVAIYKDNYEYDRLKLFLISVLWRASVSTHHFFSKVRLGPWEEKTRQRILHADPGSEDDFGVLLSKFVSKTGRERLVGTVMDPFRESWHGVNAYRLYFGRICAYIKVDQRRFSGILREISLTPRAPLFIVVRTLETSNDVKAMVAVVKGARK